MVENITHTLYVNTDYDNEVTLDCGIEAIIKLDVEISWQTLIEDVLSENIASFNNDELMDYYQIERSELNTKIDSATFEKYQDSIYYWIDNSIGGNARAFDLITSLSSFTTDEMGNGSMNGVTTSQSTCNGPKKSVCIENEAAADWLKQSFANEGIAIEIKFT